MVTFAPDLSLGSVAVTLYHSKSMETSPITSLHTVESSDSGCGVVNTFGQISLLLHTPATLTLAVRSEILTPMGSSDLNV